MSDKSETTRLAIGPANFAGQAYAWAKAARTQLNIEALSFSTNPSPLPFRRTDYMFPIDRLLPHHRILPPWLKRRVLRSALGDTTHIAVDGFLSVFDRLDRSHAGAEVRELQGMGMQVALIAHGSDVRDPTAHMTRNAHSYFRHASTEWVQYMETLSQRNRESAKNLGVPCFVSTPDLLLDLPDAIWLPLTIDESAWRSQAGCLQARVPKVLHIPSRRNPPIKGTEFIEPAMRRLHAAGMIEYVAPSTGVRHAQMRDLVHHVDVVIDQIMTGSYGVAAIEAMASGKLVVGNVSSQVRSLIPGPLPVVDATPDSLEDIVRSIAEHRQHFAQLAETGPQFVSRWHDGTAACQALEGFLTS